MNWNEKVAIVTGASSGIGLAVARKIAARGGRVALVARSEGKLQELAAELGAEKAAVFPLDVTDRAGVLALPGRVVEKFGRLDILVNNAGVNHRGDVKGRSGEELAAIIDTNLVAPILLTQAALHHLGRGGCIVNVASLAGKIPLPEEATYSASKWGLRLFGKSLHFELNHEGIRVCNINPGPVDTGFFGDAKDVPDVVFSQPMSTPEQIADAVMEGIEGDRQEIDVPAMSGRLATMGYLFPAFFLGLRPLLEKQGAKKKAAFIARKQGS